MAKKAETGLAIVEQETDIIPAEESAVYAHKLKKPFDFEGEHYEELSFEFDKLTANDCLKVERELRAQGHNVIVETVDSDYLIRLAARACTKPVGVDLLLKMGMADFRIIKDKTRNFLV